jgi:hypothetical protein
LHYIPACWAGLDGLQTYVIAWGMHYRERPVRY